MSGQAHVDNRRGAVLLILAAAIFTADVAVLRLLSGSVGNDQIVFFRSAIQLVTVAVWIAATRPALAGTRRPGMLMVRGLTSLVCWWLYYASFQALDLALATTLTFTTSLFVVAFAPMVLGERVGPRRWITTVLGFLGVVLVSGADPFAIETGVWFGLGSAAAAAALVFQNRALARTEHTATIMLWIAIVATIGTAPGALANWSALTLRDTAILLSAGGLGTLGMLLTIEAYRVGEVSALAPYPYTRIVFALAAGTAFFGETLNATALAGVAIIIACGLAAEEKRRKLPVGGR